VICRWIRFNCQM